ncbi:MAG: pentapeptide repeat-containing protein [Nostoc sp.]|uniref:pentapeptide repeat-containing protein n=1 Tax=Nostoc sp. TaxID=1180 RepID=UPI002FF3721F
MGRSCRASKQGLEIAEAAFKLKGWTQEYLAGRVGCTRQTVIKFFARRPVEKHLFKAMCDELDLEWGEIAQLESEDEQSSRSLDMDTEPGKTYEVVQEERIAAQVLTSPVSLVEKQNANCKEQLVITLTGDVESVLNNPDVQAALLVLMQKASKDASLTIDRIEKGSIKITFSGTPEGLKRLEEQITSGNLREVLNMPVENVQLLASGTTGEEQDKIRLVQEIIAQGARGRDLSDADLSGADLRGTNLIYADLSCADLNCADLRNANLEGADLNCANLRGTNLESANLNGVSLHDAVIDEATIISDKWHLLWKILNHLSEGRDLRNANLSDANLSNANLSDADLRNANLFAADLSSADLSFANLNLANLSHADLSGANLSGTMLFVSDLSDANLSGADLMGANLSGANLSGVNLSGANLKGTKINEETQIEDKWRLIWEIINQPLSSRVLNNADLSDANLSGANLSNADLFSANLSDANLSGANLSGANLSGANLSGANLKGTKINEETQIKDKWRLIWEIINQPLSSRVLNNADLSGANLSDADLSGANLSGANLSRANLSGANLSGANLNGANLSGAIFANALFVDSKGLTEDVKRDLERRGAIFSDRPPVLNPKEESNSKKFFIFPPP